MAEQDRYASHLESAASRASDVRGAFRGTSGAEQDRHASHFEGAVPRAGDVRGAFRGTSGAEQDRHASHFEGTGPSASRIGDAFRGTSGAEQDRHASHFEGSGPSAANIGAAFRGTSGAEQDRHASHFEGAGPSAERIGAAFRGSSGAEQDRYDSHFGWNSKGRASPIPSPSGWSARRPLSSGAEQDRYGSHFGLRPDNPINATAVGIFKTAILPSFGLHSGLAIIAYAAGRATNRVEAKDWLWPSGQVINAWWSSIGTRVLYDNLDLATAWNTITYPEKLLLAGVTAWGVRLFYRISGRSVARGTDDPRYAEVKKEEGFWNTALFSTFIPEAMIQTIISLPFTMPFRAPYASASAAPVPAYAEVAQAVAIFLFSSGFALELLADAQLAKHQENDHKNLNTEGVWSIVRHPNYLGDAHIHASFPLLLYSAGIMHPITLLGPIANYIFLRHIVGDKQTESDQEVRYQKKEPAKYAQLQQYKSQKNSFWPKLQELQNPWYWTVVGAGVVSVALERGARTLYKS